MMQKEENLLIRTHTLSQAKKKVNLGVSNANAQTQTI